MRSISAIVPAAGLSTRFGGPNKLLEPWRSGTIVGSVVQTLLGCGVEVVVVTGRDAESVAAAVHPTRAVFNPRFRDGLGNSIACGVANSAVSDGYLIALGDMPSLEADVVSALVRQFEWESLDAIVAPVYSDEPDRIGHPVLFGSAYRSALIDLVGDQGARSIIEEASDKLVRISVGGSLEDIDLPE